MGPELRHPERAVALQSGGEGEAFARRVENLLKRTARDTLVERTEVHRAALNQKPVKVSIGDRIDGGRVAAITDSELRYQKGGRMLVLEMPQG